MANDPAIDAIWFGRGGYGSNRILTRVMDSLGPAAHATQLQGIAGIRLGSIRDIQENDPPFAETPEEMVRRWCGEMGVPYLGRAQIGHDADNHVVPFGVV
jgi:muramoyltetrapeptide carboxypeptidase